jgi:hypothetical protein
MSERIMSRSMECSMGTLSSGNDLSATLKHFCNRNILHLTEVLNPHYTRSLYA